jgi:uncharacterized protein YjbI with pentapeptide repeats
VSTRVATSASADTGLDVKASGARLGGADLRFASAERVFLAAGDLRRADFLGADLWSADLRGAQILGTSFAGALLYDADLRQTRGAAIPAATAEYMVGRVPHPDTLFCSRAIFTAANLRHARFASADVRGAAFDQALLQGAVFKYARLTHATFAGADLDGADFRHAYGLTVDQVLAARHVEALYDSTLLLALISKAPARFERYSTAWVEAEAEDRQLSGEDEPDSLDADERRERVALIRMAFDSGAPKAPAPSALAQWTRAASAGESKSVAATPYGCAAAP